MSAHGWQVLLLSMAAMPVSARKVVVEVSNVVKDGGRVCVSASLTKTAYDRRKPEKVLWVDSYGDKVSVAFDLPDGEECAIAAHQDVNGNGEWDTNMIGIPVEPVGVTNWHGRGAPLRFDKHKIEIGPQTTQVGIKLYKL